MTHECFTANIGRLERSFPNSRMPQERKLLIQKAMKSLSDQDFSAVVDEIIANEASMPTLKLFHKYATSYLLAAQSRERKRQEAWIAERRCSGQTCPYCDDVGLITAYRRGTKAQGFSFRCPDGECVAAKLRCSSRDVRWDDATHANEYVACFAKDRPMEKASLAVSEDYERDDAKFMQGAAL